MFDSKRRSRRRRFLSYPNLFCRQRGTCNRVLRHSHELFTFSSYQTLQEVVLFIPKHLTNAIHDMRGYPMMRRRGTSYERKSSLKGAFDTGETYIYNIYIVSVQRRPIVIYGAGHSPCCNSNLDYLKFR